ncbi:hypothetical protein PG987_004744 [Apiospora arundinis]
MGEHDIERSKIVDKSQLDLHFSQHIKNKEKDPRMRHVFLTAAHSAAPLDCTLEMFQYLCTYHQVSPGFLDLICSFGQQTNGWNAFLHMHILHQLSSNATHSSMAIPEIGRSGKDLRVAYKLFAMEQQEPEHYNRWVMRQTATYHTLDLAEWKAFWITVKANDLIRQRVDDTNNESCNSPCSNPAAEALARSLLIHQVMFDWCTDGWGWYINEIADSVENILRPLTAAPIPHEQGSLDPVPILVQALSLPPEKGDAQTDNKSLSETKIQSRTFPTRFHRERQAQIEYTTERLTILKNFSLRDMRQLDVYCNKLRDARTAIQANHNVVNEICKVYNDLVKSAIFSPDEKETEKEKDKKKGSLEAIQQFEHDLSSIKHNLRSDCLRIDNISERISDGKNLYTRILDSQRTEMDKLFAMNQHDSSKRMQTSSNVMEEMTKSMHTIAEKTERDTSSMHFITFLTLLFLPGTFLGSLFSTPIFGEAEKGSDRPWILNEALLSLFLQICLPMMAFFVVFWLLYREYRGMVMFKVKSFATKLLATKKQAKEEIV